MTFCACFVIIKITQGNPTSYLVHTLTWEKGRQLKSYDGNTYTYNANGIRTSKTVGGVKHTYTLDGTKILRECWNYDETTSPQKHGSSLVDDGVIPGIRNWMRMRFLRRMASTAYLTVAIRADAKIRSTVKRDSKDRYWTATLKGSYVDIGRAIPYQDASISYSIFCLGHFPARRLMCSELWHRS